MLQPASWSSRLANRLRNFGSGPSGRRDGDGGTDSDGAFRDAVNQSNRSLATTAMQSHASSVTLVNELGERHDYQSGVLGALTTTRPVDATDMLHSLAAAHLDVQSSHQTLNRSAADNDPRIIALRRRVMAQLAALPNQVWHITMSHLDPADRAALALTCRIAFDKCAPESLPALGLPENRLEKLRLLYLLDSSVPRYLLCFHCGVFHMRIEPGAESLKPDYVNHPVFICPRVKDTILPRARTAFGRELPYAFVQLAVRAAKFGPQYGVGVSKLERRWRDPLSGWSHHTRYHVHQGHLLMRVQSQVPARHGLADSEMRMLLFDREEYIPYFSVCKHWRSGQLVRLCKDVLSHVPEPPAQSTAQKIRVAAGSSLIAQSRLAARGRSSAPRQCSFCAPGRRCPECPSEYVVKLTYAEDKHDPVDRFKFMLQVTRWCDLGDGSGPEASPEWAAMLGEMEGYPSIDKIKNRALMGIFESAVAGVAPGNRLRSLNPKFRARDRPTLEALDQASDDDDFF